MKHIMLYTVHMYWITSFIVDSTKGIENVFTPLMFYQEVIILNIVIVYLKIKIF